LGETHWGVYLVNPNDDTDTDKYLLTSPLDREAEAERLRQEFERIAGEQKPLPVIDGAVRLED
jgi:hypothetical protein